MNTYNTEEKNKKKRQGNEWGFIAAGAALILFVFIFYFNDKDSNHIISLIGAYVGFKGLGEYFAKKEKIDLLFAIGGLLIFASSFVLAVSQI